MPRSPTTVITANGSIDATEEARVDAKERFGHVRHGPSPRRHTTSTSSVVPNLIVPCGSCLSSFQVGQVKRTFRVQQKIQLKAPRSQQQMNKKRRRHRGIDYRTCQKGYNNLRNNGGTKINILWKLQQRSSRSTFQAKAPYGKHNLFTHFPKKTIVIFAVVGKLQEELSDGVHMFTHPARPSSVISSLPTTKCKGMQLLCKIWPLNGFKVTQRGSIYSARKQSPAFL